MMRRIALTLAPLLLLGCEPEAVAPDPGPAPDLAATSTWTRDALLIDFVNTNAVNSCVGEAFRAYGWVPYQMHEVTNEAGAYSYFYQFLPVTPWGEQFSFTGMTSGTVWWYQNGHPYNESFHVGPAEIYRLKWHEMYESEAGSRLYSDGWLHLTTAANGELVVDRYEIVGLRCEKKN